METTPFLLTWPDQPERRIRGRVTWPAGGGAVPLVIVVHGFKGFMDWGFFPELARRLAGAGLAAVAFNGSGSGIGEDLESFSDAEGFRRDTISRQLEDLERVRQHVTSGALARIDPGRAGLFGHSRGGGVALIHASEHPRYRAVATWAAVETFDRHDEPTKELWRRTGELPVVNARTGQTLQVGVEVLEDYERQRERFDVLRCAARLGVPLLAVHGTDDEAVAASALELIAAAAPADLVQPLRIEGGSHTFGARHPLEAVPEDLEQVLDATVRWFAERVP